MITLRNILSSTLLLVALFVSSAAFPMKRLLEKPDGNEQKNKRQKVNPKMVTLNSRDDDAEGIKISLDLDAAKHSITIENMINDLGDNSSETVIPIAVSNQTLQNVVTCLNIIHDNQQNAALTEYVKNLAPQPLYDLLIAANYLDINLLLTVCIKQFGSSYSSDLKASLDTSNMPVELSSLCAQHLDCLPTVKSWLLGQSTTLNGHNDSISSVCFSPDGTTLASVSNDKTIKIWNLVTGQWQCTQTLNGHNSSFTSVCFSPDGTTLISGSWDKTIKIWNLAEGQWQCTQTLNGHNYSIKTVCFSPDGTTLASGSDDNTIKIWNLAQGQWQCTQTLNGHNDSVKTVCFSPDGTTLASASWDNAIKIWNLAQGQWQCTQTFYGHNSQVNSVYFSPDGTTLASGSWDNTIKIWNLAQGQWQCTQTLNGHNSSIHSVCFSPDGTTLASGSYDKTIKIWNLVTGQWQCTQTLNGHNYPVTSVCFSPDGTTLASGSRDNPIKIWNLVKRQAITKFFSSVITIKQLMFLKRVNKASAADGLDLTTGNHEHLLKIYYSLPEELRELLLEKKLVRIES